VLIDLFASFGPRLTHQLEAQGRKQDLLYLVVGKLRADLEEAKDGLNLGLPRGGQAKEGAVEGLCGGGRRREEEEGEDLAMAAVLTAQARNKQGEGVGFFVCTLRMTWRTWTKRGRKGEGSTWCLAVMRACECTICY
jgi:hypothetical protein